MPPKALLLIDNCSAHPSVEKLQTEDGKIVAYFFPPNVTAALQPMDQNPIKLTKLMYRNKLLANLVADDIEIHDYLKQHSIRNAIILLKQSWDELSSNTIEKSFSKVMNWDSDKFDDDDELPLSEWNSIQSDYDKLLNETRELLAIIAPDTSLDIEEVVQWNEDSFAEESNETEPAIEDEPFECDEVEIIHNTQKITYSTTIESVNNLIKWCEKNDSLSTKHLPNLLSIRADIVLSHVNNPKKQTTITDFIKNV